MSLDDIRKQIDLIDQDLLGLLSQRADLVHEVGMIKKRDGLQIYAPEREQALLDRLISLNQGRLPEKSIRAIYREIMTTLKSLISVLKERGRIRHRSKNSGIRSTTHRSQIFRTYSIRSSVAKRITGSFLLRIRPKVPYRTPSICLLIPLCTSAHRFCSALKTA